MIFPKLTPAIFIQRNNRFTAEVKLINGSRAIVYVPTTGRLSGVLHEGAQVWLEPSDNQNRKTAFTLALVELKQGGLCSVNAVMANRLFAEAVQQKHLDAFLYDHLESEVPLGKSRLDFRLNTGDDVCWVEVKSVTYVENGVGKFPDAPTARGTRHLETLFNQVAAGERASVVFISQREDANLFSPFTQVDPGFAKTLSQVHTLGVEVHAYRCRISLTEIVISEEIDILSLI